MDKFADQILHWYDKHHRYLPWRITPVEQRAGMKPDPYRVWLSEIMLQQTTVETVKPYYQRFLARWPDIFSLARASQEQVLREWAGLGYYSRARNLKICAEQIVNNHNGLFPFSKVELTKLAGIGDYTASALAAIAYNSPVEVVDGNVERIIARLFQIDRPPSKVKALIKQKTHSLLPKKRFGDFAQAMMDLGSLICTARKPLCQQCPVNDMCLAAEQRNQSDFPVKITKNKRPERAGAAYVILSENKKIYLEKRAHQGLLAGMTEIPNYFASDNDENHHRPPLALDWCFCGTASHVFSHFSLKLKVYCGHLTDEPVIGRGWWLPINELKEQALPTVMKKAIAIALPQVF